GPWASRRSPCFPSPAACASATPCSPRRWRERPTRSSRWRNRIGRPARCTARWASPSPRAGWCTSFDVAEVIVRDARPEDDAAVGEILVSGYLTRYAQKMPEVVLTERRKAELRDV